MTEALVIGSGPNGLAAAIVLAREGIGTTVFEAKDRIGGGCRSSELTLPGLIHDDCSAFHPTGVASPFFRSLELERYGLEWLWPEIEMAHPLGDGSAGLLYRSVERTADGLGPDGEAWRSLMAPFADRFDDLAAAILRPVAQVPRHPLLLARFGLAAVQSVPMLTRRFDTERAKALFAGIAAHITSPLQRPLASSAGLFLGVAGHANGWPVAKGGSAAITDALAEVFLSLGGTIRTGEPVTERRQVERADIVIYDLTPSAVARILGDDIPPRIRRSYRRFRHGPGSFKVDLAVQGGVPWTDPDVGRAGTVHLGGTLAEMVEAERQVAAGEMPETPFVLVGQQSVADPSRAVDDVHPVWAYAHVPHGYDGDITPAIIDQIERFAPGTKARIVATASRGPAALEEHNPNYVGGDIAAGGNDGLQVVLRPRIGADPYWTGVPGHFISSAATPPGAGVHGMCGFHAARAALRRR